MSCGMYHYNPHTKLNPTVLFSKSKDSTKFNQTNNNFQQKHYQLLTSLWCFIANVE